MNLKLALKSSLLTTILFVGLYVAMNVSFRKMAVENHIDLTRERARAMAQTFSQFPDLRTVDNLRDYDPYRAGGLKLLAESQESEALIARSDGRIVFDSSEYRLGKTLHKEENLVRGDREDIQYGLKNMLDPKPERRPIDDLFRYAWRPSDLSEASVVINLPVYNDEALVGQAIIEKRADELEDVIRAWSAMAFWFALSSWAAGVAATAFFVRRSVVRPINQLVDLSISVSRQDFSRRADISTGDEIEQLAKSFNTMIYNLEKKTQEVEKQTEGLIHLSSELEASNQELNRKQKLIDFDLKLAHNIQQELLPQVYPKIKGLRISSANFQVGEIGGDCFDFYKLGETRLGAFIGDVSGKGISAALVMSMATILFSQLKDQDPSPAAILTKVNDIMHRHFGNQHSIYLTCFFLLIDMEEMKLFYSCAGHNPPYVLREPDSEIIPLESEGFGLGMFASVVYEESEFELQKGDKIILYTDGVIDSRSQDGELFGSERLIKCVSKCANRNGYRITNYLLEELEEFGRKGARTDDLTIMVIEVEDDRKAAPKTT